MTGVLIGALVAGVLVLIALAVVVGVARAWTGSVPSLSARALLAGYLYLVVLASSVIVTVGVGDLITAGFAQAFGLEFSYQSYKVGPMMPRPAAPPGVAGPTQAELEQQQRDQERQRLEQLENNHRDALAQGITAVAVGGLVGLLHLVGKRQVARRDDDAVRFLGRTESIVGLALYGLMGIVFAVMAVYQLVRYVLFPQVGDFGPTIAPGQPLGYAIAFVPVWLWRLRSFLNAARA